MAASTSQFTMLISIHVKTLITTSGRSCPGLSVAAPGGMPLMSLYTSLCVFILRVQSGLRVYSTGDV